MKQLLWCALVASACGSVQNDPDVPPIMDAPRDGPLVATDVGAFAQAGSFLHARSGHATAMHAGRLWMIGGNVCQTCLSEVAHDVGGTTSNVISAPIDAAGTIGAFREDGDLITMRNWGRTFALNRGGRDYLYVLGGINSTGASGTDVFPATVERAEITAGGGLSAFAVVSALSIGRAGPQVIVRGDNLYVLGGSTGGANGFATSIERAVIDAQGNVGPFSVITETLAIPSAFHALAEQGDKVFLLGGATTNSLTIANIQEASFTGAALGAFNTVPAAMSQLRVPRSTGMAIVLGERVFVFGGGNGNTVMGFASEEIAMLSPLGGFVAGTSVLDQPRFQASAHIIGTRFCVIGGCTRATTDPNQYLASIICAPLK